MKKFFKNIRKKSPARGGPPPEGSPKLDNRSTHSLVIGYDVREKELGKLHKAAWLGDYAKVQQLTKKDSSPIDKEKRTPLHLACCQGHERVVQILLEWKAKTNIGDADSRTPLMKAVECRQEGCVELLIEDKVELDSVDKDGNTALHIAAMDGSSRIANMLCQAGASMTVRNKEGLVPLHLAVREKQEAVCQTLLSFRGQVDIEDNNLRTPLMYACQDGSVNLVKLFLDRGASTTHKDAKGWSADDCAVIQGHHACSQLISDHMLRHQRGSAASTPRSTAGSRSATPRSPSPFLLPAGSPTDPDSASLGHPAADAGGDESGDETLSKASAKGGGSDSWGDDTDISQADDKKGKGAAAAKVNLAKLVAHLPSESDDGGDSGRTGGRAKDNNTWMGGAGITAKRSSSKSYQSDISQDDNSWAATDSPVSPRRSAVRVSFKGDKELSEVHDITATESEGESDHHYTTIPDLPPTAASAKGYIPSAAPVSVGLDISQEKHRAFMEDLGLDNVDDISEFSDPPSEDKPPVKSAATAGSAAAAAVTAAASTSDSEWDSTVKSDHPPANPKQSILKKWNKVDDGSDWDTTEAEDIAPVVHTAPPPPAVDRVEEETDVEEVMEMGGAPSVIPKEVEVMMRKKQAEAEDSEDGEDSSSSQRNEVKPLAASDLLSVTIEQSAKEYLGNDSPEDVTPQQDLLDKPSQDSEWDSTAEVATPRNAASTTALQPPHQQESDWDSTVETVTPRAAAEAPVVAQRGVDDIQPISEEDDDSDDVENAVVPVLQQQQQQQTSGMKGSVPLTSHVIQETVEVMMTATPTAQNKPPPMEPEDDESAWDSEGDTQSEAAPALPRDKPSAGGSQHKMAAQAASDTDDEMDKTETVSEWEIERKREKEEEEKKRKEKEEEKIRAEQEEMKRKEEERLQQEEKLRLERERREEEERRRRQEEEEERRRKEEERKREEEQRRQQWEREEAERAERLRAEAEEALKEESQQQQADSSEEDSLAHEEIDGLPPVSPSQDLVTLNSCQNNSQGNEAQTVTSTRTEVVTREELKRVEEQIREEAIASSSASKSRAGVGVGVGSYGSLQPQQSQGVPQASSSSYLAGPTAQQIKQRLQIGTSPSAYHSDGMESDDSLASDMDRNEAQSYPAMLGSTQSFRPDFNMADDDVLSYTSTEFEGNDPAPPSSGPFVRDVLLNMNLSDPSTLVQVQDYIRETKRHMEQERNQRTVLDNKLRLLAKEKQDLVRKLEGVTETKQSLEQNKLDLEARIRSLEYNLSEEQEKKRSAELLLTKTKEQLGRKEEQFTTELEGKQRAELIKRNIELEMKAAQNTIKDLEEEKDELERQLQGQIEHSRRLQDQLNDEQSRLAFQKHQQTMASSGTTARMQDRYMEDDSGEGDDRSERDRLSTELYAVKMELERQRSRYKDDLAYMAKENEELQTRVEELKNDVKLNEDAMALASIQHNVDISSLRSEVTTSTSALDKEHALREKLEAELDSAQKRLQVAVTEKDRAVQARNELERQSQLEKQGHVRDMEHKEEEITVLKDNNQHMSHRIHALETKLSSMESELHVSSTSLLERTNQLQLLRQDAERYKSAQNNFDTNFRAEKEQNTKLQVKIESLQERLAQSQMEVTSLKQQVDNLHTATLNASSTDPHEHLSAVINTLRSDSDRTKAMLEERNSSLMEQVQHLKEELRNADNRHSSVDAELRRLQAQHAELTHKLSFAEAQLQMLQKTKDQVDQERGQLKGEVERAREQQRQWQDKCLESQARLTDMTDRLDRAERTSQLSTQHLATTSASFTAVARSKEEMEETVQRLQMENARLDTDLRHERDRTQMLQAELTDSKKVRSSLEALCSNLKSTSAHLEEKLGEETVSRVVMAQEARDSKQLLKQELATRSALGLKVKTEGSEAKEQKQVMEAQLMEESQRNQQLQKEVSNLKSHLKAAKKKLKESGGGSARNMSLEEGSHYAEFRQRVSSEGGKVSTPRGGGGGDGNNNHHHFHHVLQSQMENGTVDVEALKLEMEMKYRRDLNLKLEEINSYLETQALARDRLETSRTENETRLSSDKRRLEEENSNLKLQFEQALAQKESSEMEARRFKQLYESEMQWRIRLSDQLHLSADKVLKQPPLLAEHKNRLYSSVGLLNKSAMSDASLHVSSLHNQGLSNKIQAELDRSIARHLEAAPHSDIVPHIRKTEDALLSQSLARSSKDYIDVLKRKYCVP
ncbi:uncharacterized protein LOC143299673 isoform X3 [Babylonia areolata]|uniref:uncharacterized protein LOC143299673 isoform X3 n=1 Tax=Babylonia areolata TaxID=304850 RepID=UPI003FD3E321